MTMSSFQPHRRSARHLMLALGAVALVAGCASVPEQYRTSRLALERGGLGSVRFTFDGSQPEKVIGLFTYNSSFLDVLAQQPLALAEARRAVPYHYASAGIFVVGTLYTLSEFLAYVSASSDAGTLGELGEASARGDRVLAAIAATTLLGILPSIPANRHMYASVGLFNAGLTDPAGNGTGPEAWSPLSIVPNRLALDPAARRLSLGWTVPTTVGR